MNGGMWSTLITVMVCAVVLLRCYVAYRIRVNEIERIGEIGDKADTLEELQAVSRMWREFDDGPSFEAVMYNPFIWTRKQVYGAA